MHERQNYGIDVQKLRNAEMTMNFLVVALKEVEWKNEENRQILEDKLFDLLIDDYTKDEPDTDSNIINLNEQDEL